jgi:hypothetical protein
MKNYTLNPRFSIIIYCNNFNKNLDNLINSIENQNFDNFEIILIVDIMNDKKNMNETKLESTDISISIEALKEKYNNIKIINNVEEKGLFYSYTKGILESEGEYILTLKLGYTFATENILNEINEIIKYDDIDILEFNLLINDQETIRNNSLNLYKCLHFKSNINVDLIKFNKRARPLDLNKELMENKVIKSGIYKSIINEYKLIFENNVVYNYYDDIIMFLINKKNIKIKHINNLGMIQYKNVIKYFNENIQKNNNNQIIKDTLFYINFLFEHSDDTIEDKKFSIYEFYDHLNIIFNRNNINQDLEDVKLLINKFLNYPLFSQYKKNLLKLYSDSFMI